MKNGQKRAMRSAVVGLLVLLLVGAGAMPAAAGAPGPAGGRQGGGNDAGAHGGGHKSGATAQQVGGSSAPAARKSQGSAARPARKNTAGQPRAGRSEAAARPKPSAARPAKPAPSKPSPRNDAPGPDHKAHDETPQPRTSEPPEDRTRVEVRSSTASPARRAAIRGERPSEARATIRPLAASVTSSGDPSAALFAPSLPAPVEVAAVDREPRRLWPALPGPAGHPAFPALLAGVLLGFVALGCRGDRRDPKLAAAAIDDRDDRARFR